MSLDVARLRPPDRPGMLRLFTEPQFSYKSFIPDLLDEGEIDALVGAGTLVCRRQDDVVGLIELEEYPAGYRGHFLMHARFATRVPAALAAATVDRVLSAWSDRRPLRRVSHTVCTFDQQGLDIAYRAGFSPEGTLDSMVGLGGKRFGLRYLARRFEDPAWPLTASVPHAAPRRAIVDVPSVASAGFPLPAPAGSALSGSRSEHSSLVARALSRDDLLSCLDDLDLGPVPSNGADGPPGARVLVDASLGVVRLSEIDRIHRTVCLSVASRHPIGDERTATLIEAAVTTALGRLNLHRVYGFQAEDEQAGKVLRRVGFEPELSLPNHTWRQGRPAPRTVWARVASR
jgi:hypothetical protein